MSTQQIDQRLAQGRFASGVGIGAIPAAMLPYISQKQFISGHGQKMLELTLTNAPITVTDALAYAGIEIYDFLAGLNVFDCCVASLQFTVTSTESSTINNNAALTWGLGTVTASSSTLATTMQNIVPITSKTLAAAINVANTVSRAFLAASARVDGNSAANKMFLNVAFATGTDIDADGTMTISGTILLRYYNADEVL